ncbi:MAG: ComEA family DNA-binding protein [Candidatus Berkelbacteria bacterium]|nr:ComEA family DNA-binding protein [Candidatus Berkelbacteria bacterium]
MDNKTGGFEGFIFQNRYLIGSLLLTLVVFGSVFLLWRTNYFEPAIQREQASSEQKIKELEEKLSSSETNTGTEIAPEDIAAAAVTPSSDSSGTPSKTTPKTVTSTSPSSTSSKTATPSESVSKIININTASATELDSLPGIGPSKAAAIIDYRTIHGPFSSIEAIKNVKGIGDVTYSKLKDLITI